jgi:citrate lyase gamma subunit
MEIRKKAVAKNLETLNSQVSYEPCNENLDHRFEGSMMNQYGLRIKDVVQKVEKVLEDREREQQKLFVLFFGLSAFVMFLVAALGMLGV